MDFYFLLEIALYVRGEFEEANKILKLLDEKKVPYGRGVGYNFITGTARYASLNRESVGDHMLILKKYIKDYKPGQQSKFNFKIFLFIVL